VKNRGRQVPLGAAGRGMESSSGDITLKVFRFDPEDGRPPRYDRFAVEARPGTSLLEALTEIAERQDHSLAFRYSCRGAVCGSCAMWIQGRPRLACRTQLQDLKGEVLVAPLPHLTVLKDLVVDMAPFYQRLEAIMPYLIRRTPPPEKEFLQSPQERRVLDEVTDCIWCGACYSSCPIVRQGPSYLGPAALLLSYRFAADTRDEGGKERLSAIVRENGVWRCRTVFNCAEVCPKKINPARAIEALKRKALTRRFKLW